MEIKFKSELKNLINILGSPIYVVGGYVRNYLIDKSLSLDVDLAGTVTVDKLCEKLGEAGFTPLQVYKRTGTVVFEREDQKFEYTTFRREVYSSGGEHTPTRTEATESIFEDATRRDFKCNAVYYDILNDKLVDPLDGAKDIENKILDTVTNPEQVFCHDGLRLMRLARFAGELNFSPTLKVLASAKKYAENIKDISKERVYSELIRILDSDCKYSFSDKFGHYTGLKILDQTGVLDYIIPELALGRNMKQRADFHDYDVLEHTLKTVAYSDREVRLSALFHDIGKPYCMVKFNKYHLHAVYGENIAKDVLLRLKAPNKIIDEVCFLTANHMKDIRGEMKTSGIRKLLVLNLEYAEKLIKLMQADFSGCKDNLEKSPIVLKWEKILEKLKIDGTPLREKDLALDANALKDMGYAGAELGKIRKILFLKAIENPAFNKKEKMIDFINKNKKHIV